MLVLKTKIGQAIRLVDTETARDLGRVMRIKPNPQHPNEVLLGFDLIPAIQILRESLLDGSGKKTLFDGKESSKDVKSTG